MRYILLLISVGVGYFLARNPILLGRKTGKSHSGFAIIDSDPVLDDELFGLASTLRPDFKAYRNHCLRVATFTKYFLPEFVEEEIPNAMELVSMALAYHDLGLWSDNALAYLEPSLARMEAALLPEGNYSSKEMAIMKEIILQHHKVTDFHSDLGLAADALVNAVRKADWADATMGVVRFGMPEALLEAAYDNIPEAGFHNTLLGFLPKLSTDLVGMLDIVKIFKW
jgi:hypothetical protein